MFAARRSLLLPPPHPERAGIPILWAFLPLSALPFAFGAFDRTWLFVFIGVMEALLDVSILLNFKLRVCGVPPVAPWRYGRLMAVLEPTERRMLRWSLALGVTSMGIAAGVIAYAITQFV